MLQTLGFLAGLALLAWCVRTAMSPENRESVRRLADADPRLVAAVLGLSALSLAINGLAFFVAIRPVRTLPAIDVVATNCLVTFLNYLPFKIGAVTRFLVHNRRDGMPVLMIGAWIIAVALILVSCMLPLIGASLWRHGTDLAWFGASFAGLLVCVGAVVVGATLFAGERGHARLVVIAGTAGGRLGRNLVSSRFFRQLLAGLDMLADVRATALAVLLRLSDVGVQTARFLVVAKMLHEPLTPGTALIAASCYFLIGILSPAGMLGAREGGTAALLSIPGVTGGEGGAWFAAATLLVGAAELVANSIAGLLSAAWLRPWKFLHGRSKVGA